VDAKTEELREAHDARAELYAEKLAHILDQMPVDRAVLGLFCDLITENGGQRRCAARRPHPLQASRR